MKKFYFVFALLFLAGAVYAQQLQDRGFRKQHSSSENFIDFNQNLNINENQTTGSVSARQTNAQVQNITDFEPVFTSRISMTSMNCIDQGATHPKMESLIYTQQYFDSPLASRTDSVQFTFYDKYLNETPVAQFMLRFDTIFVRNINQTVRLRPDFSYQLFTENDRREFLIGITYVHNGVIAPGNNRERFLIVDELGNLIHYFDETVGILLHRDGDVRRVITTDADPRFYLNPVPVLTNQDTTTFRVWDITPGSVTETVPASVVPQAEYRIGTKNIMSFQGEIFDKITIEGTTYYYIAHYKYPYSLGNIVDGNSTPNNVGIIELFNFENSTSFKRFTLPMPNWTNQMDIGFNQDLRDFAITRNVFTNDGKFSLLYSLNSFIVSGDYYNSTLQVVNEDGEVIKSMNRLFANSRRLADVAGQNPLYAMFMGEAGEKVEGIFMFDPISWEQTVTFMPVHNGEPITINFNRIPYGEDYAFIFGMNTVTASGGTNFAQMNYYDKAGGKIRELRLDIGALGIQFSPALNNTLINPYLINADAKREFVGFAPRRVTAGSDVVTNRIFIYNEDGELLYQAEADGANPLRSGGTWTIGDQVYFTLMYGIAPNINSMLELSFYRLPFAVFTESEGDGTEANPYLISSAAQFDAIRLEPAAHYKIVADIDLSILNAWTTIPTFSGTLDGQNYVVRNFVVANPTMIGANAHGSLFGSLNGATIENLRIEGVDINFNVDSRVATIAWEAINSTVIRNVHVSNASLVIQTNAAAFEFVMNHTGGIVALLNSGSSVENSSFEGNVEASSNMNAHIGGIAGSMGANTTIINSRVNASGNGRIVNTVNGNASNTAVGGIVGQMQNNVKTTVLNNTSGGTVTNTSTNNATAMAGGIVGDVGTSGDAYVGNCYSTARVTSGAVAGGVVGRFNGNGVNLSGGKGLVENSYATGVVRVIGVAAANYGGGVVGAGTANNSNAILDGSFNVIGKHKLNMSGLVALNDTVWANPVNSRRVVGRGAIATTAVNDSLYNIYALSTMVVGQTTMETRPSTDATSHDGADVMGITRAQITQTFFENIGWKFGTDSENPWVWVNGAYPVLWFEVVNSVELNEEALTLVAGKTHQLTATVNPVSAINKNVSWESSNTAIATVDENGLVTAIAAGTASITVTTEDGGFTAICVVTVIPATYTIAASTNAGGTITPSGDVVVARETNQTFTFAPNTNFKVAEVLINGVNNTTAVSAGTYTFTNVTANHTIEVVFEAVNSVPDVTSDMFNVYPNPVRDVMNISTEQTITKIEVIDLNGRIVLQLQGNNREINLQSVPAGNYTMRIHTEAGVAPVRIVKQ
jgi:hypothetical protein